MIKNRPQHLLNQPGYQELPPLPLSVNLRALPEFVRVSLVSLSGIQPITISTSNAAGGALHDKPNEGEIGYHQAQGTMFQIIFVVVSVFAVKQADDTVVGHPYALSLMPASKRGLVEQKGIDLVAKLDVQPMLTKHPAYAGYDPFTGDWRLFAGSLSLLMGSEKQRGFLDEIGLVTDQYYLADKFDPAEVLLPKTDFLNPKMEKKLAKHRTKLFFTPFKKVAARRIWGASSPIELFLAQELATRGLLPHLQMLILNDGTTFPSLFDLWRDVEFRHIPELVTEADLYFPEERIAVFCDSTKHHRGEKNRKKDEAIDRRLMGSNITPIRVPGRTIVEDVRKAADLVVEAL